MENLLLLKEKSFQKPTRERKAENAKLSRKRGNKKRSIIKQTTKRRKILKKLG